MNAPYRAHSRLMVVLMCIVLGASEFRAQDLIPFQRKLGGIDLEALSRVVPLPNGDLIALGRYLPAPATDPNTRDVLLVRFDASGSVIQAWTLGQSRQDEQREVGVMSNGDVIVLTTGQPYTDPGTRRNGYLSRISLTGQGSIIWQRRIGSIDVDAVPQALLITIDQKILVAGITGVSGNMVPKEAIFMKFEPNGNVAFGKALSASPDYDSFKSIVETADGYYLSGVNDIVDPQNSVYKASLTKFDLNGNLLWSNYYDDGNRLTDFAIPLVRTPDGNLAMAFGSGPTTADVDRDLNVLKVDLDGAPIWGRRVGTGDWENVNMMALTHEGQLLLSGNIRGVGAGDQDGFIVTMDQQGEVLVRNLFGKANEDQLVHVIPIAGDSVTCDHYIGVGASRSFNIDGSWDGWIMKLNSELGGFGDCHTPNVPMNNTPRSYQSSTAGTVMNWNATSTGNLTLTPFQLTSQNQACGAVPCIVNHIPERGQDQMITLAPNPSPGRFELRVEGPQRLVDGQLLDALGREVPLKRPLHAGAAVQQVELDGQAKGLYLMRLTFADGGVRVVRVVVE